MRKNVRFRWSWVHGGGLIALTFRVAAVVNGVIGVIGHCRAESLRCAQRCRFLGRGQTDCGTVGGQARMTPGTKPLWGYYWHCSLVPDSSQPGAAAPAPGQIRVGGGDSPDGGRPPAPAPRQIGGRAPVPRARRPRTNRGSGAGTGIGGSAPCPALPHGGGLTGSTEARKQKANPKYSYRLDQNFNLKVERKRREAGRPGACSLTQRRKAQLEEAAESEA
jgi:hypothetical protein